MFLWPQLMGARVLHLVSDWNNNCYNYYINHNDINNKNWLLAHVWYDRTMRRVKKRQSFYFHSTTSGVSSGGGGGIFP